MATVNRSEASRALAKAIAYAECGKRAAADEWARKDGGISIGWWER